jgi:tripartite-type tricarboxylate transporter receptor subunit TctC
MRDGGIEPMKESSDEFAARLKGDYKMWGEVVKAANIKAE